jgi:hypothetical protein
VAKKGFLRRITERIVETVKAPFVKKVEPKKLPPFSLKAQDAETRAERQRALRGKREFLVKSKADRERREKAQRRQRVLRAKRKQIEYRKKREGLIVERNEGSIEDRIERYLAMNKRDRSKYHPDDAEPEFWHIYDGRVQG